MNTLYQNTFVVQVLGDKGTVQDRTNTAFLEADGQTAKQTLPQIQIPLDAIECIPTGSALCAHFAYLHSPPGSLVGLNQYV